MISVQSLSHIQHFLTPWIAARQASMSITNSWRLRSIKSVMPSSYLILCRPLLLLPPIPPSIRVFSNESTFRIRWPKYWSFSFSIIPSKEHPGLISFRMDWLDLLAVQGTLKSLVPIKSHVYQCHDNYLWEEEIIFKLLVQTRSLQPAVMYESDCCVTASSTCMVSDFLVFANLGEK